MKPLSAETLIQDRYKIVHLIGKGGMGEVYLAVDQRLGSAVALKRTFFSDDEMLAAAFEREARILANLRHQILPKVSDHFIDGDNQYLVMEHIAGDDLSKRLENTKQPFPVSWVLFWADQLLDSLNYLHTHDPPIIHRDIKPQNLKLTDDNHIVLLDFGLSKNSVGETRITSAASSGSVIGYTPHYAPMEQIRGTGTGARSDIYSLSATLYQLLTNIVPPDALTRADSLLNGLPDPIKPISDLNKEVTVEVSEVILKGMEVSQDKRPENAREMQKRLRDAYAKLKDAMSAQTIAFNINDENIDLGDQTGQNNETPIYTAETQTGKSENNLNPVSLQNDQQVSYTPSEDQNNDFDKTIQFDAEADLESAPKQADVKTEVFLAGESSAINLAQQDKELSAQDDFSQPAGYAANDDLSEDNFAEEDEFFDEEFSTSDDISTPDAFGDDVNYSPDATVPLVSVDNQASGFDEQINDFDEEKTDGNETDFFSIGEEAAQFDSDETFDVDDEEKFSPAGQTVINDASSVQSSVPVIAAPVTNNNGNGKTIAVVGGLLGLLVLILGAAGGIAWYFLSDNGTTVDDPTPAPTVAATATPEPTPTLNIGIANDNSEPDNVNLDNTNGSGNTKTDNSNNTKKPNTPKPTNTQKLPPPVTPRPQTSRPATPQPRTPRPATPRPATPKPATPKPTIKQ